MILLELEQGFDAIPDRQVTWQDRAPANYGQLGLQPIKRQIHMNITFDVMTRNFTFAVKIEKEFGYP